MTKTVDPFAGSYVVESMTDDVEAAALELIQAVEDRGGAVAAIEQGFQKSRDRAVGVPRSRCEIDSKERTVVGLNRFALDEEEPYEPLRVDPQIEHDQRGAARRAARRARQRGGRSARSRRSARRPAAPTTCSTR